MKPARTETFEHTISGLLAKRVDLFNEAERIRNRLAEVKNDIGAVDRVLTTLGYAGDLKTEMPRYRRPAIFGDKGATRIIMDVLRTAEAPLSSRMIARKLMVACGQDPGDKTAVSDRTNRASRVLRRLREQGLVVGELDQDGCLLWELAPKG
jgi:hypothetical protein